MRRGSSFPWILVGAGAVAFWTLALGMGIPSLARLIDVNGTFAVPSGVDPHRCIATASVDGREVVFGECINVRFLQDVPDLAPPAHVVPYQPSRQTTDPSPETLSAPTNPVFEEIPSVGRTAY
jgi:hypothetical protein